MGNDPVPGCVLLRSGQDGNGPCLVAVSRQRPVRRHVRAQQVRQDQGVTGIGLAASDGVPIPVTCDRQRIDRIDRPPGRAQGGDEKPAPCLDRHRDH